MSTTLSSLRATEQAAAAAPEGCSPCRDLCCFAFCSAFRPLTTHQLCLPRISFVCWFFVTFLCPISFTPVPIPRKGCLCLCLCDFALLCRRLLGKSSSFVGMWQGPGGRRQSSLRQGQRGGLGMWGGQSKDEACNSKLGGVQGRREEGRGEEGDETQEHKHGTALRPAVARAACAAARALSTKTLSSHST